MEGNISYNFINKIRTKLLLFIDKEMQPYKINRLKKISNTQPITSPFIQFEEIFTQKKPDDIYYSFSQNNQNIIKSFKSPKKYIENRQNKTPDNSIISEIKKNKNKKNEILHTNLYSKKTTENNNTSYLEFTHHYKTKNSNLNTNVTINLKEKVYPKKISMVQKKSKKPKKNEEYLKKLCNSLKIMKLKQNRKTSSVCFYTELSKSKEKHSRIASSNLSIQCGKNNKNEVSTSKHIATINRNKNKVNKIKTFYRKLTKKDNSNFNNINTASMK